MWKIKSNTMAVNDASASFHLVDTSKFRLDISIRRLTEVALRIIFYRSDKIHFHANKICVYVFFLK